jgi:hypothetical protein
MRDKAGTELRELEAEAARLAKRRQRHEARGSLLAEAETIHEAIVERIVLSRMREVGLTKLPLRIVLEEIHALAVTVVGRNVSTSEASASSSGGPLHDANGAGQKVFVKIGRNVSSSNRRALEGAGLHWYGRDPAGWKGTVTASQLVELRRAFGRRVEEPEQAGTEADAKVTPEDAPEPASTDVTTIASPTGEEQGPTHTSDLEAQPTSSATPKLRSSFGFPSRRPTAT